MSMALCGVSLPRDECVRKTGVRSESVNILLIDDEVSLRKSLRLALETMGHRVTEAGDSAQAQEYRRPHAV